MYVRISDDERDCWHENCLNIVKRHCRVGKVSPKPPKHWGKLTLQKQPVIPCTPDMQQPWGPIQWWQDLPRN